MTLRNNILSNWENDINGHLQRVDSLDDKYPAFTFKMDGYYGVALPIEQDIQINEDFSNAKLKTQSFYTKEDQSTHIFLTLTTEDATNKTVFSSLCEQFIFPGEYGEFRNEITDSPLKWWIEMKQILGNKNVEEMVYDTLGELWVYDYLVRKGVKAIWNGPKGSSADIESDEMLIEVKSTLSRSKKEITVHGKSQLKAPPEKDLYLYFCVFEMSSDTGYSINDIVYGLANDGYDVSDINLLLSKKGFELGKSSRDRKFILWNVYKYYVDEKFPKIIDESFVGGKEPEGINSISYTIDLSGISCEVIIGGEKNV